MILSHLQMGLQSIRTNRVRSFLTMLGVIIGVAAVVLAVNVGQGVKQQVTGQIDAGGGTLITVRSGRVVVRDQAGKIVRYSLNQALGASTLTNEDLEAIRGLENVALVTPLTEVSGTVVTNNSELIDGHIIGTTAASPTLLGKDLIFGSMFTDGENQRTAVIGYGVAEEVFADPSPIGRVLKINSVEYIVKGVFDRFQASPVNLGVDLNRAVFIPYASLPAIGAENATTREILVRTNKPEQLDPTITAIQTRIKEIHGQEDFSVLRQSELVEITNGIFGLVTSLVAAVAAISLIVGGIGITNIMLVSVAERTREIGIRKAIGASNAHILWQFLIESVVLSLIGGLVGVLVAIVGGLIIRGTTSIKPVFDIRIVCVTIALSVLVGVIFGVGPAWKAARKRPIESLRS